MPPSRSSRRRPPTLRDVAEIADVSIKTVSNVVNDYPHVRPSTRERVEKAIARTGYRPQLAAQQLRTGASGIVTLAVPSLTFSYFSDLAQTFIDEAQSRGRTVVLHTTSAGRDEEIEVLRGFRRRLGDGVIFNPMHVGEDYLARMAHVDQPTVFIGEHLSDTRLPPGSDYVRIDNTRATADATAHLLENGRRRLAFVGALGTEPDRTDSHSSSGLRIEGFRQALWRHDLDPALAPIQEVTDWHRFDGREAVHQLLDAHPEVDGLVCGNDEVALGALAGLRDRGKRVPADVAVIGYDDSPEAPFAHPALTTIRPDKKFLVKTALDMLIERINGYEGAPRTITAPHELVVRGSSSAPSGVVPA